MRLRPTCWPTLDAGPAKFCAFATRDVVVAFDLQARAFVARMTFAAPLEGIGDGRVSAAVASAEMVSQDVAGEIEVSGGDI